ncbi:MAG: hypothetical protein A3I44_06230 [Candidatus Sungbacteria bacterium RIFCSPLOWO2_02_FULL_51_17]|uniref:DUF155 domain-containing protein n=1 Tax=Candidatus Sungbacteria bacterium RIFCSPHIGHO2_02_FULL_51_29 TaxID=1802273 RepID=A0A1G2KSQ1_9BACT|nr:MAG: hypothetical protein A2676_04545 [Candidatus Sungbacteria bacterium RIFCSPHIGHO2_01_FULL_51_22]OHA01622.1 MAG: hypothetical protein A3C16_02605 [Candidatus Sungbacteria bacterium RIFCSPHIGHO2_02_FULL_51_29]OHA06434.1 MAG: hypothetical protein A3B29_04695 [Candidatus Sungbacteria bacterium RIFCSPLOWO2_01_FULL_51_34]OHA10372.1 MAG: hypothetical protein A3I44_06230 [Candidatus Sungbacteria bacterium RIFCSPLOWO2_02_FULL_51_17]
MKGKLVIFVICETAKPKKASEALQPQVLKSAPHYFQRAVPQQHLATQEDVVIGGHRGTLLLKTYPPDHLLAEVTFDMSDILFDDMIAFKEEALSHLWGYLQEKGGKDVEEFSEEYTAYIVSDYSGDPEQFFVHKERIAGLLKTEKLPLDSGEVEYTLSSQIKYAKDDLVIVDWDGAFIFDAGGDYESTLELLELANWQLLRFRILDRDIDTRLLSVTKIIESTPPRTKFFFKPGEVHAALKQTMLLRTRSISEFQALEREFKLVGDWYSARLYELVAKKFKLEELRAIVKDKLDALEDVYTLVSENFTISWEQRSRIAEMIGWYVLLLGWLILLILDFYFYKY